MTKWERLKKFEIPLAMPVIMSGIRTAAVMIIGTATLAALIGAGGLGSFILLGIGNAIMQVSLNPLIANLVSPDRYSSTLTSGQFVKAIASFSAPLIASWLGSALHMWWLTYVLFLVISVVAYLSLLADKVEEKKTDAPNMSFGKVLGLLKDKIILLCFIGIMCHVGMDAGVNTYAPRFLIGAHAGMGES